MILVIVLVVIVMILVIVVVLVVFIVVIIVIVMVVLMLYGAAVRFVVDRHAKTSVPEFVHVFDPCGDVVAGDFKPGGLAVGFSVLRFAG